LPVRSLSLSVPINPPDIPSDPGRRFTFGHWVVTPSDYPGNWSHRAAPAARPDRCRHEPAPAGGLSARRAVRAAAGALSGWGCGQMWCVCGASTLTGVQNRLLAAETLVRDTGIEPDRRPQRLPAPTAPKPQRSSRAVIEPEHPAGRVSGTIPSSRRTEGIRPEYPDRAESRDVRSPVY
jgi:hypothetical protein